MNEQLLAIRQRLFTDFEFYAANALKVRTKDGTIAPLVLKPAQLKLVEAINKQMVETGRVRMIILKARQLGFSTAIGAWLFWWISQHEAQRAMVVTHASDSTRALFDLTRRYLDNVPDILKPHTKYASRRELFFDVLDSSYIVGTAGSESIGRGETITHAHLSELAYWPSSSAREVYNGLAQAIPSKPGTAVFIESTANGMANLYKELWDGAVKGENHFYPLFVAWFEDPEYREAVPDGFERTPEEETLARRYGLDNEQLMFRRKKIAENGLDYFQQEFPSCPEDAFLTTGRPVFIPELVNNLLAKAPNPIRRLSLEGTEWKVHPRGELLVYREYEDEQVYTIGADTSAGIKGRKLPDGEFLGDLGVAQVLDKQKRQVAILRGYFAPDYFADLLFHLGKFYNNALIAPEANNHGILTLNRLYKELAYPYVYQEIQYDKTTDQETIRLGWITTVKSKPLAIDKLRASVRDGDIQIYDKVTLREMLAYVVDENGAMGAEKGFHDDCVMSLAIANHVHEGNFTPVENHDDFYVNML